MNEIQALHKRIVCSCGTVIAQCRCIGPHVEEIRFNACGSCLAKDVKKGHIGP